MMANNLTTQSRSRKMSTYQKLREATFGRFRRADPSPSSNSRDSSALPIVLQQPMANEAPINDVPPSADATSNKNDRDSSKNVGKHNDNVGSTDLVNQKTLGESKLDSHQDENDYYCCGCWCCESGP
ncbi:hypothetical protein QVD17_17077 [Tagetes erecta]|uniref:Uncharacterized protein n=1 Tax=Tagetes erecta TaxID=13708 RepID=A0AAD8KXQ3_TARER|nr:hypothetical protein QVD17_17077 [Tagetes erecta]